MSAPTSYLTIARAGEVETEVKRSRFLCRLRRVDDEDQARAVVDEARREHWDARHHCSAFVLGPACQLQRSSDDGEPAGTAGAPMLEVLRGREVSDVVAVVSRHFGGTLLGAGGLVRAYSDAVRAALDDVGVVRRRLMRLLDVTAEHADAGRLEHDLRARGVVVEGVTYAERATLRMAVPDDAVADFQDTLAELTSGAVDSREAGSVWADSRG
jgi:uncharacterized YigZ family protein